MFSLVLKMIEEEKEKISQFQKEATAYKTNTILKSLAGWFWGE
jgi:hypothetical protein